MKTAIITPDLIGPEQMGGIGTFVDHFSKLLRQHDCDLRLIYTGRLDSTDTNWIERYRSQGIDVRIVTSSTTSSQEWHDSDWYQRNHGVVPHLENVDLIYTQDYMASSFLAIRKKRYKKHAPVFVNILHGCSEWTREGNREFADLPEYHLSLDFAERYVARYSDFVVSPSQYMLNWATTRGWRLPAQSHQRVLGYPFFPPSERYPERSPELHPQAQFKRLIFFGRLEARKGLELFADTLCYLKQYHAHCLQSIQEIVLLGKNGLHRFGSDAEACEFIKHRTNIDVIVLNDLDSYEAQEYVQTHGSDALVVLPSLVDNYPLAVIEVSLLPGVNALFSATGGITEIMRHAHSSQFFEPSIPAFAERLESWLTGGPCPASEVVQYDWEAHNHLWSEFHKDVCEFAQQGSIHLSAHGASLTESTTSRNNSRSIEVVIPDYKRGSSLHHLLKTLSRQSVADFGVLIVDMTSSLGKSESQSFNEFLRDIHDKGWKYFRSDSHPASNTGLNYVAKMSKADYLLFLDPDILPLAQTIARFREAIEHSGVDCLTSYTAIIENDTMLLDHFSDDSLRLSDYQATHLPLGASAELGLFAACYGHAHLLIKRDVFVALGGFPEHTKIWANLNDLIHEFVLRLVLADYDFDVLPEFLFVIFEQANRQMSMNGRSFDQQMSVLDVYRLKLRQAGLEHLTPLVYGLHMRANQSIGDRHYSDPAWLAYHIRWYHICVAIWLKVYKHVKRLRV